MIDVQVISSFDNLDQDAYYARLQQYASLYYNTQNGKAKTKKRKIDDAPAPINDETWDALVEGFELRYDVEYADIGASVEMDGNHQRKTLLPRPMASQNKAKSDDDWQRLLNTVDKTKFEIVKSDKCDGVSAMINYYTELVQTTRGNGTIGTDISHLLPALRHRLPDPQRVKDAGISEVRVELELTEKDFEWVKKNVDDGAELSNARNTVAGLINGKTFDPKIVERISVFAYKCYFVEERHEHTPWEEFELLQKLGFKTPRPELQLWDASCDTFDDLLSTTKQRMDSASYAIDGMIVTLNVASKQESALHTFDYCFGPSRDEHCKKMAKSKFKHANPAYSVAVKLPGETYVTEIIKITYSVSRHGGLSPTIHFKTVDAGVNMNKATGKSGRRVKTNNLKAGDTILVRRANLAIPEFLMVLKSVDGTWEQPPKNLDWQWNGTGEDMVLTHPENSEDVEIAKWVYFFEELEADHIGETTAEKLYHAYNRRLADALSASAKDLLKVDGFKDGLASKVRTSIQRAITNVNLVSVMKASSVFGAGLGQRKLTDIVAMYPDILSWNIKESEREKYIAKLQNVPGIKLLALQFVDNLTSFQAWLKDLPMITLEQPKQKQQSNGMVVVFSGKRNKDAEERLVQVGGKVGSSVTKITTHLVMDKIGTGSTKEKAAIAKGVTVLTMTEFTELLKQSESSASS